MAVTVTSFKAAHPEFAAADDAEVDQAIADAYLVTPDNWGNLQDLGVQLCAAHALALSPFGRGMEVAPDGTTVYERRLNELKRIVGAGGMVS